MAAPMQLHLLQQTNSYNPTNASDYTNAKTTVASSSRQKTLDEMKSLKQAYPGGGGASVTDYTQSSDKNRNNRNLILPTTTQGSMIAMHSMAVPSNEELKEITMETARKLREQYRDKEFIAINEMSPRLVKHKKIGSKQRLT